MIDGGSRPAGANGFPVSICMEWVEWWDGVEEDGEFYFLLYFYFGFPSLFILII